MAEIIRDHDLNVPGVHAWRLATTSVSSGVVSVEMACTLSPSPGTTEGCRARGRVSHADVLYVLQCEEAAKRRAEERARAGS